MSTSPITTRPSVFPEQPATPYCSPSSSTYGQSSISASTQLPATPQINELASPKYDESKLLDYWSIHKAIQTSQKVHQKDAKATKASIMQAFQTLSPEVQEQFYKAFENQSFQSRFYDTETGDQKIDVMTTWFATAEEEVFNHCMCLFTSDLIYKELRFFLKELQLAKRKENALEAILASLMKLPEFPRKIVLGSFFCLEEKNIEQIFQDSEKIAQALKQAQVGGAKIFDEDTEGRRTFFSVAYIGRLNWEWENIVDYQGVRTEKMITASRKTLFNPHGVEVAYWAKLYWAAILEDKKERQAAMALCLQKLPENMQKELIALYRQHFNKDSQKAQIITWENIATVNFEAADLIYEHVQMDFIQQGFVEIAQGRDGKSLVDVVDILMDLPEPIRKVVLYKLFNLKRSDIEQISDNRAKLAQTLTRILVFESECYINGERFTSYKDRYFTITGEKSLTRVRNYGEYPWEQPMVCSEAFIALLNKPNMGINNSSVYQPHCSVVPLR